MLKKQEKRLQRHKKVRAKISGTAKVPRFSLFRSNKHIYCQLIDDEKRKTLVAASDSEIKSKAKDQKSKAKTEKILTNKAKLAFEVGKLIAERALKKKIEKVVFDRGGVIFHGRVKSLTEGASEAGLKF